LEQICHFAGKEEAMQRMMKTRMTSLKSEPYAFSWKVDP
jgi:hypothetical protein